MLKVLIADDEPYVREGLKYIIDWEALEFNVCGEATDGDDCYNKIIELQPDLVLIDIKMPGKTGLDVIKESIKIRQNCKFIIVSGYSDFQYAKVAMKYGVKSYILKPVDEDELLEIIKNLKLEIISENNKAEQLKIKDKAFREYVLEGLLLNKEIDENIDFERFLSGNKHQVALISVSNNTVKNDYLIKVENICKKQLAGVNNIDIIKIKNKIAIIFNDINDKLILDILHKLKNKLDMDIKVNTFISVGQVINCAEKIHEAYLSADKLMDYEFIYSNLGVISDLNIKEISSTDITDEKDILDRIYSYVEIGESEKIERGLIALSEFFKVKGFNEKKIKALATKNYLQIRSSMRAEYTMNILEFKSDDKIIEEIYNKISLDEIITYLIEELTSLSNKVCVNTSNKSVKRIVKYIEKNYNKDLKLEFLADVFSYNSAYLGKVIKSNTGKSFNTYLDEIRINKAKELLIEDNLKVYEVCEKVGYKNIDYFHSKFKKYVGVSPLNYKKQSSK